MIILTVLLCLTYLAFFTRIKLNCQCVLWFNLDMWCLWSLGCWNKLGSSLESNKHSLVNQRNVLWRVHLERSCCWLCYISKFFSWVS